MQNEPEPTTKGGGLDRALLQFSSGLLVAGGLVLAGILSMDADPARSWVKVNLDRLPQNYADLVSHPMDYRRAIYQELAPATRSALWVEHLQSYRAANPNLSEAQTTVLTSALDIAAVPSNFAADSNIRAEVKKLSEAAAEAFGSTDAVTLLATLGPIEEQAVSSSAIDGPPPDCSCTDEASSCRGGLYCGYQAFNCQTTHHGCGSLWLYDCNGVCIAH